MVVLPSASEANFRSAISRGYYAVFISIQTNLLKQTSKELLKNAQLSNQLAHEFVIRALCRSSNPEISEIGKQLGIRSDARKVADYNMTEQIEKKNAEYQLKAVQQLLADIDTFGLPRLISYLIQHIRDLAQARSGTQTP